MTRREDGSVEVPYVASRDNLVIALIVVAVIIAIVLAEVLATPKTTEEIRAATPAAGVTCYVYRDTAISCVRTAP